MLRLNWLYCVVSLLVSSFCILFAEGYSLRTSTVLRPRPVSVVHAYPIHGQLNSANTLVTGQSIECVGQKHSASELARVAEFLSLPIAGGRLIGFMRNHQLAIISLFMVVASLVYGMWTDREFRPSRQSSGSGGQQRGRKERVVSDTSARHIGTGPMPLAGHSKPELHDHDTITAMQERRLPPTGEVEPSGLRRTPNGRKTAKRKDAMDTLDTVATSNGMTVGDEGTPPTLSAIGSPPLRAPLGEQMQQELADQPAAASPAALPAAPAQQKTSSGGGGGAQSAMGFLGKFFQKPGGGRPSDVTQALQVGGGGAVEPLRVLSALALLDCMPSDTFPQSVVNGVMSALKDANIRDTSLPQGTGSVGVEELGQWIETHGVSSQHTDEAFADVTNALLVALVDAAVHAAGSREDALCVARIEAALQFMAKAGHMYDSLAQGVHVEPIRYNGRARLAQLDDLFYRYAKAAMNVQGLLSGFSVQQPVENAGMGSSGEDQPVTAEERQERLGRLQFLFGMKDGRRGGIEQRILRESMTEMVRGVAADLPGQSLGQTQTQAPGQSHDRDLGSLSNMLDGMLGRGPRGPASAFASGATAAAAAADPVQLAQAMQESMSKMRPEDMAALSTEVVAQMKTALREGAVTKQDVLQLEKMMGARVKDVLAAVEGAGRLSPQQLRQAAGPEAADMVAVFRELAKLLDS